jgi:predicted transcriptional regulator
MSLKGNIETFYLSSILQLLCGDKKNGVLTITEGDRKSQVYFKDGSIVYASGSRKEVRLGYLLRSKGIISAEELQNSLNLAKQRRERLGKVLVEKGYISTETLKKFIHQQVRENLYELFLWQQGEFEYVDQEVKVEEGFATSFNPLEIILEGTRRVDEWAILKKNVPHSQVVFRISKNVEQQDSSVNLTANEWRVLSLVDGRRTVQQVVADCGHDEFSVYRVLNSLISSGLIEKSERQPLVRRGGQEEAALAIQVYHEFLQNVRQVLAKTIGDRSLKLMEDARARLPTEQQELLRNFSFDRDAKGNVELVLKDGDDSPPQKDALLSAFSAWSLAILRNQKGLVDEHAVTANLQELSTKVAQWQKASEGSGVRERVLEDVLHILGQALQEAPQSSRKDHGEEKGGGILSFFKRK